MIYLYGSDTCTACKQAVTILGRTWLEWQYIDVATLVPPYDGEIPLLILEDGSRIVGLGQINNYVKNVKP